jgi:formate hydrogenlyase transcriptional activator
MPPELQVKLLRVLQEHEFERVGGRDTIKVDVRVVAATNRDLLSMVEGGLFRRDLYYRLNVFPIRLPPLRGRTEDIPLLVHYFAQRYAAKVGRKISRVPRDTMNRLVAYEWSGNVRELENVIERAVILSPGCDLEVAAEQLPSRTSRPAAPAEEKAATLDSAPHLSNSEHAATSLSEMERNHITAALKRARWRINGPRGAARALNLNPSTLRSRIKKLGIRRSPDEV